MSITVRVNGEPQTLSSPLTLDALIAAHTATAAGLAAALNETVVPRSRWSATPLADGDRVEILTAVQGG